MKHWFKLRWLIIALLCLGSAGGAPGVIPTAQAQSQSQPLEIRDISWDAGQHALIIQGNRALKSSRNFTTLRLPNPERLVIDIPDAILATRQRSLNIGRDGLQKAELSESRGMFYNAARITLSVKDVKTLNKLAVSTQEASLRVGSADALALNAPPTPDSASLDVSSERPIPPGRNVIDDIVYRDNQLWIHGKQDARLVLKNRFLLANPSRLVLDLDNTAVSSKSLLAPIDATDGNMHQIRIGQFDDETVRIVIEADAPERISLGYPGSDKSALVIHPDTQSDMAALPADVMPGQLENVYLDNENGQTIVRLTTTVPMVKRVVKNGGRILVDLTNIAAIPGAIRYDREQFPSLQRMRLENLTAGQPNSKLVVDLKSPETQMETHVTPDGKTLEIDLQSAPSAIAAASGEALGLPNDLPVPSVGLAKAPYAARVVIDAGHGGKDLGANRDGVNEKDLNLAVVLRLKEALEARGVKTYLTRSSDEFLPLPEITRITNEIHPDLFVSVHTNSSTNSSTTGLETYYFTPQSQLLAKKIHLSLVNAIPSPDRGVRTARFYVIHHTSVPAVLCEMGYISNPEERRSLQTESRRMRTVNAIADGVVQYLQSRISANARR